MSPAQIRDRLDERFRLLTGSRRSFERHQTLRHAVQWSYDLLTETEQRVLQRVAVFAGGFTLAAANSVCAYDLDGDADELAMLDVLDSLVRKSLVQVERSETDLRYATLETIRQFAEERLADGTSGETVRDRHASFFADQAEALFELFRGPHDVQAYRLVDDDMANVPRRSAGPSTTIAADAAIRIAACVHQAARSRLRTETFGWAAEVAEVARRLEHRNLPLLLAMAADSAWALGLLEDAKRYGREAIALADDPQFESCVWAYSDLAQVALFEGDLAAALEFARTGAAHPADHRDRINLAVLISVCNAVGHHIPDDELADAMTKINEAGFPLAISLGLTGCAERVGPSDPAAAIELCQRAIAVNESSGDQLLEQSARAQLVSLLASADDPDRVLAAFIETVNAWCINGDTILAGPIGQLVILLVRLGHLRGAVQLYGAVTRSVSLEAWVPELEATMATAATTWARTRSAPPAPRAPP